MFAGEKEKAWGEEEKSEGWRLEARQKGYLGMRPMRRSSNKENK
jgi:hypothetical protein